MSLKRYQNGMIYKLCCKDTNIEDIYIGSTCNFSKRKHCHKNSCNNINNKCYNCYKYKFIRDNGGWDNWDMILIESYPCNNKLELHKKEREYIENLKPSLNSEIPSRQRKEYDNIYYINNKNEISKQKKEYYKNNKEKIKEYREENKEKIKEYYKNNKDKINERNKEYRENNKDKVKEINKIYRENNKIKITCECGAIITKVNKSKHEKTKKHINKIKSIEI